MPLDGGASNMAVAGLSPSIGDVDVAGVAVAEPTPSFGGDDTATNVAVAELSPSFGGEDDDAGVVVA